MKISQDVWKSYIDQLSKINKKAAEKVADYYRSHPNVDIDELISYAFSVANYYGEAAGELACEMYDEVASVAPRVIPAAESAATATYGEIAQAIQGAMLRTNDPDAIGSVVGRKVKTVGLDSLINNSLRDGAEFAWIPSGDTCPFCMMLASNGWQRASKKALKHGHASHVHNNCDCTYAIRFDHDTEVEGYDPDYYKRLYDEAEGGNWKQKVNAMRRDHYAANKDLINAQKRVAYAKAINEDMDFVIASHSSDYKEYLSSIKGDTNRLRGRQKRLLARVSKPLSWVTVKANNLHVRDIAALTAATGDEFAIFQKGSKKILLRGKGQRWKIPQELLDILESEQWVWDSHSHPVIGKPLSSTDDRNTLRRFTWQKKSVIINLKGETAEFSADEQEWFNSLLGVK